MRARRLTPSPGRRGFMQRAATLAALPLIKPVLTSFLPGDTAMIPIVDTHQHLWDLAKFRLPWLAHAPQLDRNFLMADYLKATEGLNVVKSVYMEVDVEPAQQVKEAEYVIGVCRKGDS